MSISAPEAHHTHLPDKIVAASEEYDGNFVEHGEAFSGPLPTDITEAPADTVHAAERLRAARPSERVRAIRLGRTAIVTNMAGELLQHAHDTDATPESRRLAIQLASSALSRHYARAQDAQRVARRHL